MATLRELLGREELAEVLESKSAKHLDVEVLWEHRSVYEGDDHIWWPGQQRNVWHWWQLANGYSVGHNENPSRGWSFPTIKTPASVTKAYEDAKAMEELKDLEAGTKIVVNGGEYKGMFKRMNDNTLTITDGVGDTVIERRMVGIVRVRTAIYLPCKEPVKGVAEQIRDMQDDISADIAKFEAKLLEKVRAAHKLANGVNDAWICDAENALIAMRKYLKKNR